MTDSKAEEQSPLFIEAACEEARLSIAVELMNVSGQWLLLRDLVSELEDSVLKDPHQDPKDVIKRALDLNYELTGNCVLVSELLEKLGLDEDE